MSAFYTAGGQYERVTLREDEFESLVPRFWKRFAPRFSLFPWKPLVEGPAGRARPDAVAVSDESWFVVELELASHPASHFRGQFESLAAASYGTHLRDSLSGVAERLGSSRVNRMLMRERPDFLCIADEANDKVTEACMDYGFHTMILTPYKSEFGDFALDARRIPAVLRDMRGSHSWMLTLGAGTMGGRYTAAVPPSFPNESRILVRLSNSAVECQIVKYAGGARRLFLPSGYAPDGRPPVLTMIDPSRQLYELS